jgi:hypothetical protein
MKKETLEELAERFKSGNAKDNVIRGVEWQKERIIEIIVVWKKRQLYYESIAEKHRDSNPSAYTRYVNKAQATRDCWKELSELLNTTIINEKNI